MPCTAQTTGFQTSFTFGLSFLPGSWKLHMLSGRCSRSLTSTPVQNARSPAACSTTTRTSSSSRVRCHTSANSSHIRWLKALSLCGRFSVTVATWSATSCVIVVYSIGLPPHLLGSEHRGDAGLADLHRRGPRQRVGDQDARRHLVRREPAAEQRQQFLGRDVPAPGPEFDGGHRYRAEPGVRKADDR